MGIKKLFVNEQLFIVTINNGKETNRLVAKKGERVQFMPNRFVTVGNDTPPEIKQYVDVEPVTSDNKYKVKIIQKELKKKNKK